MSLVTFKIDVFPHCKGDVVELDGVEKQRIDAQVKLRHLGTAYVAGDKHDQVVDVVDGHNQASVNRAANDRTAVKEQLVDQAAVLEAQRSSVAEPANVDALGVVAETDQVVTGNAPVDGVEVSNPQAATDIGSDEGAKITKVEGKKVK